jgi:hypothetical protein
MVLMPAALLFVAWSGGWDVFVRSKETAAIMAFALLLAFIGFFYPGE